MENYIIELNLERDYDEMIKLLLKKDKTDLVKEYFCDVNVKVLLSSFLIKNFFQPNGGGEDNLIKISKTLCENILNKDLDSVQENYKKFYECFMKWREQDIRCMKQEIEEAREQLEGIMTEHEPEDDAEEQWNEGVKINVKLMDNTIKMLDIYGKTPPKI